MASIATKSSTTGPGAFSGCILALVLGGAAVVATMPVPLPSRRDR